MKMNRRPKNNLAVIQNFILDLTHSGEHGMDDGFEKPMTFTPKEMYGHAKTYVENDHVDGGGRDEEILIDLWLEAEECNRNGENQKSDLIKIKFSKLYNEEWIDTDYVDSYLESIAG